jgi:hypothetical protein
LNTIFHPTDQAVHEIGMHLDLAIVRFTNV